jgi:hypothetical protein
MVVCYKCGEEFSMLFDRRTPRGGWTFTVLKCPYCHCVVDHGTHVKRVYSPELEWGKVL